jgi:hypothetical protein
MDIAEGRRHGKKVVEDVVRQVNLKGIVVPVVK